MDSPDRSALYSVPSNRDRHQRFKPLLEPASQPLALPLPANVVKDVPRTRPANDEPPQTRRGAAGQVRLCTCLR